MTSIEQQRLQTQQTGYRHNRSEMIVWFATGLGNLAIAGAFFHYCKTASIIPTLAACKCFTETRKSFQRMNFDAYRLKHSKPNTKEV